MIGIAQSGDSGKNRFCVEINLTRLYLESCSWRFTVCACASKARRVLQETSLFKKNILLQSIYNSLSISAVQQSDPVIYIYIHTHGLFIVHRVLSQVIRYSSLCYPVGPRCLSVLNEQFASTNPKLPVHPTLSPSPLATQSLFSMSVSLFLFCRQVHLCCILDSTNR